VAQLVCPAVVGRDTELARLEELLAEARQGRGRLVLLSGEAGIGKTRLARELAERARAGGSRALVGRAVQASTPIPYRPLAEALQAGLRGEGPVDDPSLDPYRAALRRLLPAVEAEGPAAEAGSPLALMEGLLRLVGLMATEGGLLLVLEDLHWADADTLAVVEYLADHLHTAPVLALCTERTDTSAPATELIAGLVARRAAERLELTPLADDEVAKMARLTLGAREVPAVLRTVLRDRASGVPFLVEEMLSAYVAAGGPEERRPEWWISRRIADALPPSYRAVVRERLEGLDDGARGVVEAGAVLGRSFDWRLLATITGAEESKVLERLRVAVRGRLVVPTAGHLPAFEFRHALAREAVLAELLPPERAALAARVADAIETTYPGLPGEWCQRVADLREDAGEPLRAQAALQEAARRAIARSAFATAEQILVRARELAGDDYFAWLGPDGLLLDVYSQSGKAERVLELGHRILSATVVKHPGATQDDWLARLHLRIARGVAPAGDWSSLGHHLDEARRLAEGVDDHGLVSRIDALAAQAALATGDVQGARELAARAERSAESLELWDALCEALDARGRAESREGDIERGVAALERCREVAEARTLPRWRVRALLALGTLDQLTRGETGKLVEGRRLAAEIGAVSSLAAADLEIAWAQLAAAKLGEADATLAQCLDACRVHRLDILAEALTARCMLHALRDECPELEAAAEAALGAAPAPATEARVLGNGRAVLALVHGDESGALEHLAAAIRLAGSAREWSVSWWPGLRALLETAAGDAEASDPAPSHDPRAAAYLHFARAIARGRAGQAGEAAREFAAAERTMAPGWRQAHAELVVARCAFGDGWGEPERWMRDGLTLLDVNLPRFASACKATLRKAGAPVPRRGRGESAVPDELRRLGITSREMDVLLLVGERLSNKEIGARLYLSPRTIEGHVASLIRKLDLESRPDLIDAGRRFGAPGGAQAAAT
jgi:DNA-binding CsgD family transcriptional regulator